MDGPVHLRVESGPERGREIFVPSEGVRIGRSTRNDVMIQDPAMSRFHCRVYFKPGQGMWVTDLGSANDTLVNGQVIQEVELRKGDEITIGETRLRVVNDVPSEGRGSAGGAGISGSAGATPPPGVGLGGTVDLGFGRPPGSDGVSVRRRRLFLLAAALVMALAAVLAQPVVRSRLAGWWEGLTKLLGWGERAPATYTTNLPVLDLTYERVQGSTSNIFRYFVSIGDGRLVVQVDDMQSARHVRREKKVDPELLQSLARSLETSGFFGLSPEYRGVAPGIHDSLDLSVTIGVRTHRTRLVNHLEPEVLANVRGMVEEFGRSELGLAALAIDPATLVEKAREAFWQAQKMHDEREIRPGNLFQAIRSLKEAEWYLETIEPKPEFCADVIAKKRDWERELQERHDNLLFLAERAIRLEDWPEAARHLRILAEMIPDRGDERHRNVYKKLVEVERRLATRK